MTCGYGARFTLTPAKSAPPARKNAISTASPARWLANTVVASATSVGPRKDVTFPDSANSPKNSPTRSGGASRAIRLRDEACSGPATRPISRPSPR